MGLFNKADARVQGFRHVMSARDSFIVAQQNLQAENATFLRLMGWKEHNPCFWYKHSDKNTEQVHKAVNMAIAELTEELIAKVY